MPPKLRPLFPLEELLAATLAEHGIAYGATPVVAAPVPVRALWDAFRAFSVLPIDGLLPGLKMPRQDLDTLAYEPSPPRTAQPNIPAAPSDILIARRVWLYDASEEHGEGVTASLRFVLADDSDEVMRTEQEIYGYGSGGPGSGDRNARWLRAVEQSAFGACLATPEIVVRVMSD